MSNAPGYSLCLERPGQWVIVWLMVKDSEKIRLEHRQQWSLGNEIWGWSSQDGHGVCIYLCPCDANQRTIMEEEAFNNQMETRVPSLPTETKPELPLGLHSLERAAICLPHNASASTPMCEFLKCHVYHDDLLHSICSDQELSLQWKTHGNMSIPVKFIGLNGHEFEQVLGAGDGQGGLACCSPWGRQESDVTEWLNWTELIHVSSSQRSRPNIAVVWPVEHSVITLYIIYDASSSMGRMHGSETKREELVVVSITILPNDPRPTFCFQSYNLGSAGLAVLVPKMWPLFSRYVTKIPLNWKLIATWPFGLLMLLNQQARKGLLLWTCWDGDSDYQVKIRVATVWWGTQSALSCNLWILDDSIMQVLVHQLWTLCLPGGECW